MATACGQGRARLAYACVTGGQLYVYLHNNVTTTGQ